MRQNQILGVASLLVCAALVGCGSTRVSKPAPVEDRSTGLPSTAPAATGNTPVTPPVPSAPAAVVLPGAENAGKPGYYTVKPGETLIRIALEHGQNWRDIARWNSLSNPNVIEIGQVLRVVPPGAVAETNARTVTPVVVAPSGAAATPQSPQPVKATGTPPAAPVAAASPAASPAAAQPLAADEDLGWIWPAAGSLLAGFDESKNKGLDIAGKAGDAVNAAADGRVVYAGAGLRGYGNLIILKHNNTYLTAYAHNQTLLVKEDQNVRKGQKIAEMGSTDADRVKLHFEIRRQGKPVDPAKYLPPR